MQRSRTRRNPSRRPAAADHRGGGGRRRRSSTVRAVRFESVAILRSRRSVFVRKVRQVGSQREFLGAAARAVLAVQHVPEPHATLSIGSVHGSCASEYCESFIGGDEFPELPLWFRLFCSELLPSFENSLSLSVISSFGVVYYYHYNWKRLQFCEIVSSLPLLSLFCIIYLFFYFLNGINISKISLLFFIILYQIVKLFFISSVFFNQSTILY